MRKSGLTGTVPVPEKEEGEDATTPTPAEMVEERVLEEEAKLTDLAPVREEEEDEEATASPTKDDEEAGLLQTKGETTTQV